MPYPLEEMLVVGITSRALFHLDEADAIYRNDGLAAYRAFQRAHEHEPLAPGTAFPLVRGLLSINEAADKPLVEVFVISRNDADSGIRIFNSIEHHALGITRGAFTDGRDAAPYLTPFHGDLFLSADEKDVRRALENGIPAALILPPPERITDERPSNVHIAFDGDAVLFDDESERVFREQGLEAFQRREARLADEPMKPGPFEPFLMALKRIQGHFDEENSPVRTALVTARNAPAHKRVINTLRAWDVRLDETFFLGGVEKASVLEVLRPHIFFDDQKKHLETAYRTTPSAHVISDLDATDPSSTP
jgi:5'-nucleotidase